MKGETKMQLPPGCVFCNKPALSKCGQCGVPVCNTKCQNKNWITHKPVCRNIVIQDIEKVVHKELQIRSKSNLLIEEIKKIRQNLGSSEKKFIQKSSDAILKSAINIPLAPEAMHVSTALT